MAKQAIPEKEGYWLMLFDDIGALAHTEKMGNTEMGFGNIGVILQIALKHEWQPHRIN